MGFFNRVNINLSHIWFHNRGLFIKRKHRPMGCFRLFCSFFPSHKFNTTIRKVKEMLLSSGPQLGSTNEIMWMCQQALPQGAASERSVRETMRQFPHDISEQRRGTAGAIPPVVYGGFKSTGTWSVAAHLLSTCRWTPQVLLANAGFYFFFFYLQPCTDDNDNNQQRQQRLAAF